MKILVTADLHYTLKQYDWLVRAAPDYDLVIVAGDCLDIASTVDGRAQIVVVQKYLERVAALTQLMVCSGNHDLCSRDANGEKVAQWLKTFTGSDSQIDGDARVIDGALFSVFPWWDGPHAKQRIAAQMAQDAELERQAWIWIYHAPPAESRVSREGERSFGDPELGRWIEIYQPDLVVCGHVHNAPFLSGGSWIDRIGSTMVMNAGCQIGEAPAHIIIDTKEPAALWLSIAGAEAAPLDRTRDVTISKITVAPDWLKASDRFRDRSQV